MAHVNQLGDDALSKGKGLWRREKQETVQTGETIQALGTKTRDRVSSNLNESEKDEKGRVTREKGWKDL